MESHESLCRAYQRWQHEAEQMAGRLQDLSQRATVYHHLFEASGRNHVFPLLAAHGALWAGGYFRFGLQLGKVASFSAAWKPGRRAQLLAELAAFADAFRDINRRVCIDTYASFHFTASHGEHPQAVQFVPAAKLTVLNRMHHARCCGAELSTAEKLAAFEAFFRSEQATVVGPRVAAAADSFGWPLMKRLALMPLVRFSYFGRGEWLWFRNFASQDERIANGLRAFDIGARVGWTTVEARLGDYALLPSRFFAGTADYFESMRAGVMAGAAA